MEFIFAKVVTPSFLVMLGLLIYPSFLTQRVLSFMQASVAINEWRFRVVHILLLVTGLYFLSNLRSTWERPEVDFDFLPLDLKMTFAKKQRNFYLSAVSFFCVLYTWRLSGIVGEYLGIRKIKNK